MHSVPSKLSRDPGRLQETFLVDLISNRVPPGVDDASYAKARPASAHVLMCCISIDNVDNDFGIGGAAAGSGRGGGDGMSQGTPDLTP